MLVERGHLLNTRSAYASDDTEASCVGDCSSQLRSCCHIHASQKDWMLDLEQISDCSADLLCMVVSHFDHDFSPADKDVREEAMVLACVQVKSDNVLLGQRRDEKVLRLLKSKERREDGHRKCA